MGQPRSEFLRVIKDRGFFHQCTDLEALDEHLSRGCVVGYIGFDATADSLHIGHVLQIMRLRWLQRTGHRPIALLGGGTTKIGDPTGRDAARQLLSDAQIAANIACIQRTLVNFLDFGDGPTGAILVNNADWLDELQYIPFLRDYGRYISVNRMLTFDSVKLRLGREQPLTFLEFNYSVLQAYDFLELARRHGCLLQMGGSDQWGNIVSGVDVARRADNRALYGLTSPLLTTASGAKMGKTAAGAVWLNPDRMSPYDYWQYWRNTDDADVGTFLRQFTELPLGEIARLEALAGVEINEAKKILATEATTLCHGAAAAAAAAETARRTFEQGRLGDDLPAIDVDRGELATGVPIFVLLARAGLAASNGEARRLVRGGGGRVNDTVVEDEERLIGLADLNADGVIKLSAGRKRHALVRPLN